MDGWTGKEQRKRCRSQIPRAREGSIESGAYVDGEVILREAL